MSWLAARRLLNLASRVAFTEVRCASTASGHAKGEYAADKETHFGYENVSEQEKAQKVHQVFESVANKYDLMNDLMSGGIHRVWKDSFVSRLQPRHNAKLLDVAGGTGDIVFRYIQHLHHARGKGGIGAASSHQGTTTTTATTTDSSSSSSSSSSDSDSDSDSNNNHPLYEISVCDISENMLKVGRHRAEALGYHGIKWVCGDAQKLPFEDDEFDCYTIAFGIRNVVDVQKALDEAYRVLKPGGRFMCLEFSYVNNPAVRWMYDQYSFNVIPAMGQVVAGDWASYQYLVQSIRKFPDQETFKEMIEDAGFRSVRYENLTFGVSAIHSGFKI